MMPSVEKVTIVTPWFPSRERPYLGAFVRAMVDATAPGYAQMIVHHCDEWAFREGDDVAIGEAFQQLLPYTRHRARHVGAGWLVRTPVPLPVGLSYAQIARRHETALRLALAGRRLDTAVVHAHVGLPGGWAALHNAKPDARVFVTEHSTFLDLVLSQPEAREMYDELLGGCAGVLAVGEAVRRPLVEAFPHHSNRIGIIANPVSFETPRTEPVRELRRWLYVGALVSRKRVDLLLEAFARCRADDGALSLTVVGDGELRRALAVRAAELGVAAAVSFVGAVAPEQALRLMREHDLLVHPSRFETFGMTVVEAVAAGMPVLVTRCGGPEETLAGVQSAAGEMIDVEESPDSIVAGYRRLRARFPEGMDLAGARSHLEGRFGYHAVAAAYHRVWFAPAGDRISVRHTADA